VLQTKGERGAVVLGGTCDLVVLRRRTHNHFLSLHPCDMDGVLPLRSPHKTLEAKLLFFCVK
jgi:hypothetical protein